jgi:hypothetical protein
MCANRLRSPISPRELSRNARTFAGSRAALARSTQPGLRSSAGLTMRTYGHVIDELEDAPRIRAEDAIMAARRRENVRTEFG